MNRSVTQLFRQRVSESLSTGDPVSPRVRMCAARLVVTGNFDLNYLQVWRKQDRLLR